MHQVNITTNSGTEESFNDALLEIGDMEYIVSQGEDTRYRFPMMNVLRVSEIPMSDV